MLCSDRLARGLIAVSWIVAFGINRRIKLCQWCSCRTQPAEQQPAWWTETPKTWYFHVNFCFVREVSKPLII